MSGNRRLSSVTIAACMIVLVLCLSYAESSALKRFLREAKKPDSTPEPSICHKSTPCGWSVYTPNTKEIDYFMPNTCVCTEGLDCIRSENDLSISAFVHICRQKPETTEKIV